MLQDKLERLIGLTVSDVIAGGANGSIIILELGKNFSLTVYCSWRLDYQLQVLTGCNESPDSHTGNLARQARSLRDDTVAEVSMSQHFDLQVTFVSGKTLRLFCDVTPLYEPIDYDENWSLCDLAEDRCYVVTREFRVVESPYGEPE